jgi:Tfp pilus assembly protein PilV
MNRGRRRRGFTLFEALAATVIVGLGIVAILGALGSLTNSQARAFERERMQRLAVQKYDELVATGEIQAAGLNGDFTEWNLNAYEWDAEVVPTGIENLEAVTVQVRRRDDRGPIGSARGLVFIPPVAGTAPEALQGRIR